MARNPSGTYSLAAGNPVAASTVITTTWANPTLEDVADGITNSLDRNGQGGMLAPLKGLDGIITLPGFTFSSEVTSGLYRAGAADIRFSVTGLDTTRWVDDSSTAAGSQRPFEIWNGSAWVKALAAGGAGTVPDGTLEGQTLRWNDATGAYNASSTILISDTDGALVNTGLGSVTMHATTMDVWAQPNTVIGTGSAVTITDIVDAPNAGATRSLYLVAGTTITNGATFAVQGGSDYTTVAGDVLKITAATVSTFTVEIVKADGKAIVAPSAGGATTTSSGVSITLTSSSNRVQVISMTAADLSLNLPVATTLSDGGPLYIVKNEGLNTFAVRDAGGGFLTRVESGQTATLYCTDITTSAGAWLVGNETYGGGSLSSVLIGTSETLNAVSSSFASVTMLTETKAICTFKGASNYWQAVVLEVSGTSITAGTIFTVLANTATYLGVSRLSDTQVITACVSIAGYLQGRALNISGTTITAAGTPYISSFFTTSAYLTVRAISSTKAIAVYTAVTTAVPNALVLEVSSGDVTAGSVAVLGPVAVANQVGLTKLADDKALFSYNGTSSYLNARVLSVTGTTITAETPFVATGGAAGRISLAALSATKAVCVYVESGVFKSVVFNVSGTTVTDGDHLTLAGGDISYSSVAALTSSKAVCTYRAVDTFLDTITLNISGDTVTTGPVTAVNAAASTYDEVVKLTSTKAIVVYIGASNYLNSVIVESA